MKKPLLKELEHKARRKLVLLDYPGSNPDEVKTINEFDKVFDGTVLVSSAMSELDVRKEIADALHKKESSVHNFSLIQDTDFEFVKCIDKKVRLLDGDNIYDGHSLKNLYSGAIYVRLKCPLPVNEVCEDCLQFVSLSVPFLCILLVIR